MNKLSRDYLNARGITDEVIEKYGIDGTDEKIIIPIKKNGETLFNKYRTFPHKQYLYDKGASVALFGLDHIETSWCVLTEGELDTLRLASEDIPAVSGTGGAGSWKDEWATQLPEHVFICYDNDTAGKDNALKIHWKLLGSKIVDIPEVKDVTDYMSTHSREDFTALLKQARTVPKPLPVMTYRKIKTAQGTDIEKAQLYPIEELIKFTHRKAPCIWHKEKTASLHLYPNNTVYCFGCAKHGNAIDVYRALNNCSFTEALSKLI